MNTTRRSFLAFLGATVAAPALAKIPTPRLAAVGEIGPEAINLPYVPTLREARRRMHYTMLRWDPVEEVSHYVLWKGTPGDFELVNVKDKKAQEHALAYGMGVAT